MIQTQIPRVPVNCPPGYGGWYIVAPGDTLYCIAQRYGISANTLVRANPHISNPNILFVGDQLCVPFKVTLPCSFPLKPVRDPVTGQTPSGVSGAVSVYRNSLGRLVFNIAATLPPPHTFGDIYNQYRAYIMLECSNLPAIISSLTSVRERPQHMFTALELDEIFLSPKTRVTIGLANEQHIPPPPGERLIFEGFLGECGC